MEKVNKAVILPVLAGLALIGKKVFGVAVTDAELDILTDAILGAITLVGVFMKPKK